MAERTRSAAAPLVVTLVGAGMAWAGSQGGVSVGGLPVFAIAIATAYLVQWVAFVPAYLLRTEKYFDLTGSFTYVAVMTLAVALSQARDARSLLLLALVIIWAGRLGPFLFRRVRRAGKDDRFDGIKHSFVRFLTTWTLQGLWVSLTLAAALGAVTAAEKPPIDALAVLGAMTWAIGFGIEAVADAQKSRFRSDPANKGAFVSSGLWSRSRHPNYFGEIVLWTGVALIALPVLEGWRLLTLVSPLFVYLLLTRVSGVPLLERKADATWGGQEDYEAYKRATPVLVPRLRRPGR
ncbi:MAG: DUF1295 domain-containing protein [Aeromicrobium sp.]|jgi:steroid 5-alpha reductase family enzyme|nr:DUF1295 domain-containing protein [Aeromicrobium sp.]